jgi:hypothetical protein
MRLSGFDANVIEPSAPREVIAPGKYKAVITKSEERPTKAQTGSMLVLTCQIIEGPHNGVTLMDRLNLNNPNKTTEEIAQRTLSAICRAVGVMMPNESSDLHDKPLMITVKVKPADGQYAASNEISGYEPCGDGAAVAAPAVNSGAATPPWKRK